MQIYGRLRKVAAKHMKTFQSLPPPNRPRIFAIHSDGWDYDGKGFSMMDSNLQDMDNVMPAPNENEALSDDEYVDADTGSQDYRQSMQLSMDSGPLDVAQNDF
jgi:hypothetical protein